MTGDDVSAHAHGWLTAHDAELVVGSVAGIEAEQLRALVAATADVDSDARVNLALTDDGALHVLVDQPERRRIWLVVTDRAEVLPRVGPADAVVDLLEGRAD